MNNGWIKIHRKTLNNPVVMKSTDHLAVWIYLLLKATHTERDIIFEGERITLKPGQFTTGRKVISQEWGINVNESKIQRILKTFEIEQQIEQQTTPRCRLISILNWQEYQLDEQLNEQQVNNKRTLNKNDKNEKNIIDVQFEEFWELYPKKVGRKPARNKYKYALKETTQENLITSLKAYIESKKNEPSTYLLNPATWLNQERWNDEIKENIKKEFRMTKTGLYIAYCPKCGKKFMPDKFQLKDGPSCHRGHSYITEPPDNPADEIDPYRDGSMEDVKDLLKNIEANA
jgi:hypothetical protein